jgi:YidC/Oxa1 family membrane protein insertase
MDIRRTILIVALLMVGYSLIVAWNEDYGSKPQGYAESNVKTPVESKEAPSISEIPKQSDAVSSDLPQLETEAPVLPFSTSSELITVETDVARIKIDPRGGDIIALDLLRYPVSLEAPQKDQPFQLLESSDRRLYQTQSGLIGRDGWDQAQERPLYQSSQSHYELSEGKDELVVELSVTRDQVTLNKRYHFTRGDYLVRLEYEVINNSDRLLMYNLYAQLKRDQSTDPSQLGGMGMQSYLGGAVSTPQDRYLKLDFDDLASEPFKSSAQGGWVSFLQHYFLVAWIPPQEEQHTYRVAKSGQYNLYGYYDAAVQVAPGTRKSLTTLLYAGPKDQDRLVEIHPDLDLTVDYGWLFWVAKPLFWILQMFHSVLANWGWAIIALTLLIKGCFYPLSKKSYTSMARMRKVAPKLQEIKERYGDDRQQLSLKMMELYRKEQINPLGGCLPILVQMPVFIALYWVLMESVELRQAPWVLWIKDLSVMDPYFVLPILMGVSMVVQMRLQPTPPDPVQANVMKIMPIIFTVFFLWFPSGLVLYWLVNNLLSIAQQWWINKNIEQETLPSIKSKKA